MIGFESFPRGTTSADQRVVFAAVAGTLQEDLLVGASEETDWVVRTRVDGCAR
jgi:hypothetical protein